MAHAPLMARQLEDEPRSPRGQHLVQGLAMALSDAEHDYSKCEVLVIRSSTDIHRRTSLMPTDSASSMVRRTSIHDNGAYTGRNFDRNAPASSVSPLSWAARSIIVPQ